MIFDSRSGSTRSAGRAIWIRGGSEIRIRSHSALPGLGSEKFTRTHVTYIAHKSIVDTPAAHAAITEVYGE